MSTFNKVNRRDFMLLTGRAGGVLLLGASASPSIHAKESTVSKAVDKAAAKNDLGVFVTIDKSGDVEIICQRMEMGQGILTSTPQIIAEELCADWGRVTAVLGEGNAAYGNQSTGGSASIRSYIEHTRRMGAVARDMLEQAAANHWSVEKSQVKAKDHAVMNLAASQLDVPDASTLELKPVDDFTLVGRDVPLQGLQDIVTGQAVYAQDIELPDMLIASIERPPVVGGRVKSFDDKEARKVAGVVDVIRLKDRDYPVQFKPLSGVAVLATNTWAAIEGRKKLAIVVGEVYDYQADPKRTVEATYTVPYHHHMSMETPSATAVITEQGATVWTGTQSPQGAKSLVLNELGLDPEKDADKVQLNTTLMGGAFGRKGKNDFTLEAVELARATGKPVKVVWSREDDVKHGYYHSIAANYFKAELNADNKSDFWVQRLAAPPISWIFNDAATEISNGGLSLGFGDVPFSIPNMAFENAEVQTHVRTGWVRAVGNINNQFGLGSFVDELATKANISTRQMWMNLLGKDRLFDPQEEGFAGYSHYGQIADGKAKPDYLLDIARFKAVLNEVVEQSNAEESLPEGQAWGISLGYSFNSYVAAATRVEVIDNKVEVKEMHTAIDCGLVITPDRVRQNNFHDYPVTRIDKVPPLHVHLMPSTKSPGGVGEPGLPPILPSITNAIFHASGVRVRDLPVKNMLSV